MGMAPSPLEAVIDFEWSPINVSRAGQLYQIEIGGNIGWISSGI